MVGKTSVDGSHIIYGPYYSGDKLEFSRDPVEATVSFQIVGYNIHDAKLWHPNPNKVACYTDNTDVGASWCVVTSDGKVADHTYNLYFTFNVEPNDAISDSVDDEVNHPKHYTGHKANVECIMFTELLPSLAANAFKYVWRCDDKGNQTEDLKKALWYLNRVIESDIDNRGFGRRLRHLVLEIIESSDFDEWHKLVLSKIIRGYYASAYDDISDLIGKPRYRDRHSEE